MRQTRRVNVRSVIRRLALLAGAVTIVSVGSTAGNTARAATPYGNAIVTGDGVIPIYPVAAKDNVPAVGFELDSRWLAALTPQGHVLWRQGLTAAGDLTQPMVVGRYLVFSGSRAGLFIVERSSGRLLELFNPGRGACAAPTIAGHQLFLLANSGSVYALDLVY